MTGLSLVSSLPANDCIPNSEENPDNAILLYEKWQLRERTQKTHTWVSRGPLMLMFTCVWNTDLRWYWTWRGTWLWWALLPALHLVHRQTTGGVRLPERPIYSLPEPCRRPDNRHANCFWPLVLKRVFQLQVCIARASFDIFANPLGIKNAIEPLLTRHLLHSILSLRTFEGIIEVVSMRRLRDLC